MSKVLFICKRRVDSYGVSFGLLNSAKFVSNMLNWYGVESKVVTVADNNGIDREVSQFKPTHVMIEAIWVVPEKFTVLARLHPNVEWIIRVHSKAPFLAMEGIALSWLRAYQDLAATGIKIKIAPNSPEMHKALIELGMPSVLLPNFYDPYGFYYDERPKARCLQESGVLNIGCFGAIRPMKNHLQQAVAAIGLADDLGMKLRFHINGNRIEQRGEEVLKNVRAAFRNTPHELVEHEWMSHFDFLGLVMTMDLGMQVSMSESFNIVAADFAVNHIPIIGSRDIDWLSGLYVADPNSIEDIKKKAKRALWLRKLGAQELNHWGLKTYNKWSKNTWLKFLS